MLPSMEYYHSRTFLKHLGALLVVTTLGFATKLYNGHGARWFNNYAGGIFYEIFWVLLFLTIWPSLSLVRTAAVVFVLTSALEFLQLWNPPFLASVRSTFLGSALIGTTFVWWEFPYYLICCLLAIVLIGWLKA